MPLYRCMLEEGQSTREERERIAKDVVRVHCDVTAAPPSFVHAFFAEVPADALPAGRSAVILGSIRAGRTDEQKGRIVTELQEAAASALGKSPDAIEVVTVDVPASWVMEGGELLPEPGEEAAWLERHR
jgi:phenylpyruvate tautomerase PptA (4-oxalocrotonate tautomerase family)